MAGPDERSTKRRTIEWVTLYGSRYAVAAGVLVAILAVLFVLLDADVVPVDNAQSMRFLFSAFVGGNFTLITVVLSINQLVFSRQLQGPEEIRTEIDSTIEYRQSVEDVTGIDVLPAVPDAFLGDLIESTRQQAQAVGGLVAGTDRPDLEDDVRGVVDRITDSVDRADHLLPDRGGDSGESGDGPGDTRTDESEGIFSVLAVVLDTNFAKQIKTVEQVRVRHGDGLREEEHAAFDDLVGVLRKVDVARQYFKTIYVQEELARLSRLLLYVGIPAIVAAAVILAMYREPVRMVVSLRAMAPVVAFGVVASLAPLAVLFSFVLRITVVAQRTAAVTPFTTPRQEQPGESDTEHDVGGATPSSDDESDADEDREGGDRGVGDGLGTEAEADED